jgi:class 3 adenylate cyclase/CHASE2 domain-containing sensor protein
MFKTKILRLITSIFAVVLAVFCGFSSVRYLSFISAIETQTQDLRLAGFSPKSAQDSRIVIAAINEDTLSHFPYRSPVDRAFLANLLTTLQDKGAKAVYLDVLFDQPTEPDKDALLKETLRTLRIPLAIGYTTSKEILNADQMSYINDFVPAEKRAIVNLATDPLDGTVRWINMGDSHNQTAPFAVAQLTGRPWTVDPKEEKLTIQWKRPKNPDDKAFATYPAHALSVLPPEWIKDKIVLVGEVVTLTDKHRTPFALLADDDMGQMAGVEVFSHELAQVLDQRKVPTLSEKESLLLTVLFALLGLLLGYFRKSVFLTFFLAISVLAGYWLGAISGFEYGVPMLPLLSPSIAFVTTVFLIEFILGKEDRERRKFVQSAFSRYLAPSIVKELIEDPSALAIQSKKRELSFIFTDIEGFTTLSEKLPVTELSDILNLYLEGMCAVIQKHNGIVDKFIGDSVMCFFNAPMDQPDHADRAIECALELDSFSQEFRKSLIPRNVELGVTRIGVHSGEAVVGNFGSKNRMDFTALGDTVNAASRTEGVNKYFGTRIIVTQSTIDYTTRNKHHFRMIGHVVLKGKKQPVDLFEPVTEEFANSEQFALYKSAFNLLDQSSDMASEVFAALRVKYQYDSLVSFHINRLKNGFKDALIVMEEK